MLGTDWVGLARELEISDSDINIIKSQYPDNAPQQAIVMLRLWMQTSGNKANGNTLEKGLRKIVRDDIVNQCIFNVELVTDDIERAMAKAHLDQSGFEAFKEELGPSRDATLNRDISLDVSYDEQDMMKEAESAEEEEENQRTYQVTQEEVRETSVVATRREGQAQQPTSQVVVEHDPSTISTTTTTTTKTSSISPTPEGFTQTSVEKSQMSSTRGTADVSTAGTTVTTVEHVGDIAMQAKQGTHEAAQIAEQQPTTLSQDQASSGLPTAGTKAGSEHSNNKLREADLAVLESMVIVQEAEAEEMMMTFTHNLAEDRTLSEVKPDIQVKVQAETNSQGEGGNMKVKPQEQIQTLSQVSPAKHETQLEVHIQSESQSQDKIQSEIPPKTEEKDHTCPPVQSPSQVENELQKDIPVKLEVLTQTQVSPQIPVDVQIESQTQEQASTQNIQGGKKTIEISQIQEQVHDGDQPHLTTQIKGDPIVVKKDIQVHHKSTDTTQSSSLSNKTSILTQSTDTEKHPDIGDVTKRVADVASSMASTLESITAVAEGLEGSHLSSDEGEEQLMLMRDSPRWEDEEIQAEDTDVPKAIKAEIKLLVKTTELGKESIEIRSIREFVETEEKTVSGFGGIMPSSTPEGGRLTPSGRITPSGRLTPSERITPTGDRIYTLQRVSPDMHSPGPRFVRHQDSSTSSSFSHHTQDEFDLMAQVRDVVQPDSGAGARQAPGSSEGQKSKTGK